MAALPLYAASLVVTLAGIGAVGVTLTSATWLPLWGVLAVAGHAVSIALRLARVPAENVFFPVMLVGMVVILQQAVSGGTLGGLEVAAAGESIDMATASLVGSIAVVRSFTLVTNPSLLFSPVPAITMLALVGSANLNAEVPVFFGLFLLASLFITGYEAHLRRMDRLGRPAGSVLFHLLTSWGMTLGIGAVALLFPLLLQPVLGQFSPFNLPGLNRIRQAPNFTQASNQRASVGQGPIRLSPTPVYEVYTSESGRLRTSVFTTYTGRDWRAGSFEIPTEITSATRVNVEPPPSGATLTSYTHYLFQFQPEPGLQPAPEREVSQKILTRSYSSQGIPGLGQITEVRYPGSMVLRHLSGALSGSAHATAAKTFEVKSLIREPAPQQLRAVDPVDPQDLAFADVLELPQSTLPVQQLARRITQRATNNYDRVQAILGYIEKNCTYTLEEEATPPGEDAAAYYLFQTKRGACDLAATAATIMCRSVGIPARIAVGYVMDEPLAQGGGYMVRQEHAHMWTEAFFPGYGWVPFDAAPPIASIKDHPLQVLWFGVTRLFRNIGGGGLDALLLVIVVLGTVALVGSWTFSRVQSGWERGVRVRRLSEASPAVALAFTYDRSLASLARRGWGREGWMTPAEYLERMRRDWAASPESLKLLERLTVLFQQAHYGGSASPEDLRQAKDLARALERVAPTRPRAARSKRFEKAS